LITLYKSYLSFPYIDERRLKTMEEKQTKIVEEDEDFVDDEDE